MTENLPEALWPHRRIGFQNDRFAVGRSFFSPLFGRRCSFRITKRTMPTRASESPAGRRHASRDRDARGAGEDPGTVQSGGFSRSAARRSESDVARVERGPNRGALLRGRSRAFRRTVGSFPGGFWRIGQSRVVLGQQRGAFGRQREAMFQGSVGERAARRSRNRYGPTAVSCCRGYDGARDLLRKRRGESSMDRPRLRIGAEAVSSRGARDREMRPRWC
jgi:hypothetical protein